MIIDEKTIHKVADLARIEIKEEEVETLSLEMNKILTFMEKLNELDTSNVKPLVYMNEEVNVWREDVAKQEITVAEGLKNSAVHNENFFFVPKIIESKKDNS
ncbi:MAG: Asp-tRNA(Asn)/Glu-tRNA(Gln) amidotransferase subunit GatC [Sphingobacteriaceae bacterium]|jgi:aspartyl-tRNA(Asn)/glutamyl-tRNA(Gln) amidotransferase subunit C|nr:Asp-tRNA(Asn)/Glu-tRNA(Gln) amidotransferase subunit GatC [Sphingobacteriaceae bacterium]